MKLALLYESKAFRKRRHKQLDKVAQEQGMSADQLYNYLMSFDPTGRKFLSWLLNTFQDGITLDSSLRDDLSSFEKLIKKGAQIDTNIEKYTPESLAKTIDKYTDYESKIEAMSKTSLLRKGFKKVKETKHLVTYQALDPHMLATFVKGRTPWCVANPTHARNYMKANRGLFLILEKDNLFPAVCFSGDYSEFTNIYNRSLHPMRKESLKERLKKPSSHLNFDDAETLWAAYLPENDFYWQWRASGPKQRTAFDFGKYEDQLRSNPDVAMAYMDKIVNTKTDEAEEEYEKIKQELERSGNTPTISRIYDIMYNRQYQRLLDDPTNDRLIQLIASSPKTAYKFAEKLGEPFPMGEKAILTSPWHTALYSSLKHEWKPRKVASFEEWPEAEPVVTQDTGALVKWCVGKGRLLEYEEHIATTGTANDLLTYANHVAYTDWHNIVSPELANKAENTILKGPSSFLRRMEEYNRDACEQFSERFKRVRRRLGSIGLP